MSNIIRIKRGATGGVVPTGLTFGELAVNITDKKLFVGGITGNTIELLASGGGSGAAGTTGIQSLNGLTGDVTLTAGSNITLTQSGNLITIAAAAASASAPPLASATLTGAASFNPIYFSISPTGHVGLASAYQVTGDTVVTNSGLSSVRSGNTVTITNIGVTAFNGLTGSVSMTGDGGAVYGIGNNTIAARVATTSVTGAASFNPVYFTTGTTGHVSLAAGYQVTGDTVSAGTGIGTVRSGSQVTISNAGVLSFNGLTGQATTLTGDGGAVRGVGNNAITARVSSASLTGVASFNVNDFGVSATGHVSLTGNVARTDRDNAFSAAQTISSGGLSVSTGATFGSRVRFDGGIYLSTPSGLTGIEITRKETSTEGVYINIIDSDDTLNIIQQSGNTANSLTVGTTRVSVASVGGLQITPVVTRTDGGSVAPTAPVQGKLIFTTVETSTAQYNATLTPTELSADRTYTLPNVTGRIGVVTPSGPGSNIIRSLNGATSGDLSITGDGSAVFGYGNGNSLYIGARNASASLTGVASFSTNDFVIGTTGHVGLTATVARTNITNNFTAVQSFPNGISGAWLSIGAGATFNERATFAQGLSSSSLWVGGGATFTGAVSISGGTAWHANNDGKGSGLDTDLVRGVNADRILEEIQSGLLYGGVITINAGNTGAVDVSAGAGIIVTVNGSTGAYPAPVLQTIEWTAKTGVAVTGLTSSDFTFFRIDSSGNLQQSASNFTQTEYLNSVVIGNAVHQSRAYVNRVHYHPIVAYASSAQYETFIRYFGPLKVDGYVLSGHGTTGGIQHTTGTAFALGANMDVDPNSPSLVTDSSSVPVQQLFYLYRNANGTYRTDPTARTTVNFGNYDGGDGTLGNVGNQSWSIQRVYKIPGLNNALYIYYGTAVYGSLTVASNNILLETFAEADITRYNGVFLGWLIVRGNGSNVSDTGDCRIVPGGFFRNTTGGGGAATVLNLDDLGDVAVTTPANNQILRYDSTQGLWINSPLSSVSTLASTSLTGVASFSSNDFVVGTTGHVGLTGTIARTNAAQTFSGVQAFSNGITTASLWVGGAGASFASKASFISGMTASSIDTSKINLNVDGGISRLILSGASGNNYLYGTSTNTQYANFFIVASSSGGGVGTPDEPFIKLTNGDADLATKSFAVVSASGRIDLSAGNGGGGIEITGASPNITVRGTSLLAGTVDMKSRASVQGLSAQNLSVSSGATFTSRATFNGGLSATSLWVGGDGATFNGSLAFQGTNAKTIQSTQAAITIKGITSGASVGGYNAVVFGVGANDPLQLYSTTNVVDVLSGIDVTNPSTTSIRLNTNGGEFGAAPATVTIQPSTYFTANRTINIPDASGTLALTGANTFSGLQTMNAGLTARNLWVGGAGATFASNVSFSTTTNHAGLATFTGGLTSSSLWIGGGATFASAVQFIGNISAPNIVNSVNGLTAAVSITSGSNVTLTQTGNLITIAAAAASASAPPLASATLTGAASFDPIYFAVSPTGHVGLASPYRIIGVTGINGLTGNVSLTAGSNVTLTQSGNLITIAAAAASASAPQLATSSLTGVASFKLADFTVSATGNVGLTGTIARTNVNNQFSVEQTFGTNVYFTNVYSSSSPPALYFNAVGEDSGGIVFDSPTTVSIGDYAGYNSGSYMTVDSGGSTVNFGSMALQQVNTLEFGYGEYIINGTNGRMDFLPAPATASAFGLYMNMTSWGYGVVLGTIRSSDGAVNTGGNIRFDVPLTINTDTYFQLGTDGQYRFSRTAVGNDTAQFAAYCDGVNNSGAYAIVGYGSEGTANRSPTTKHANPNLYIYRNGSGLSGDFMRMEHDGAVGRIASGATTGISIEPGNRILGISGGASAGNLWVGGGGATFAGNIALTGNIQIVFPNGTTMGRGPAVATTVVDFSANVNRVAFTVTGLTSSNQIYAFANMAGLTATLRNGSGSIMVIGTVDSASSYWDGSVTYGSTTAGSINPLRRSVDIVMRPPFTSGASTYTAEDLMGLSLVVFADQNVYTRKTFSGILGDGGVTDGYYLAAGTTAGYSRLSGLTFGGNGSGTGITFAATGLTMQHREGTHAIKTVTGLNWVQEDSFIQCKILGLTNANSIEFTVTGLSTSNHAYAFANMEGLTAFLRNAGGTVTVVGTVRSAYSYWNGSSMTGFVTSATGATSDGYPFGFTAAPAGATSQYAINPLERSADIIMSGPFLQGLTAYTAEQLLGLSLTVFGDDNTYTRMSGSGISGDGATAGLTFSGSTFTATGLGVLPIPTSDHESEDAILEGVKFEINNIVAGTGFDIIGHAPEGTYGKYTVKCIAL